MKFLSIFLSLLYIIKCDTTRNAKVELMFVVSSEISSFLDGSFRNVPGRYKTTKEYFTDIFEHMKKLFGLLDIELILFDFIVQNDNEIFGGEPVFDISFEESMNTTLTLEKLSKHAQYTTRSSQPDARLYFLPFHKLESSTLGRVESIQSICNDDAFGIVLAHEDDKHKTAWTAVHELGHILGALHSNSYRCLEDDGYGKIYFDEHGIQFNLTKDYEEGFIMNSVHQAYNSQGSKLGGTWSECTRNRLSSDNLWANTENAKRPHCVFEESPVKDVLNEPICGNGMVEEGEDCDSGLCCSQNCTFLPKQTMCRSSSGTECDYDDFCSGDSDECPEWNLVNGTPCNDKKGLCFQGECKQNNRDETCQVFFGSASRQSDECQSDKTWHESSCELQCVGGSLPQIASNHFEYESKEYKNVTCFTAKHSGKAQSMALKSGSFCGPSSLCDGLISQCKSQKDFYTELACPGNGTCSNHGQCYSTNNFYKPESLCSCQQPDVRLFSVITWSGDDCSQEMYTFTFTAKILFGVGLLILFVIFIPAVVFFKRYSDKGNLSQPRENDVNLVTVSKPDEQPNNESETLLA